MGAVPIVLSETRTARAGTIRDITIIGTTAVMAVGTAAGRSTTASFDSSFSP